MSLNDTPVIKCCSGFTIDLLKKVATDLDFDYKLMRVSDGKWGIKKDNKWNGLIADILEDKADMIVTALKINSERMKAIDISVPFLKTGIAVVVAIRVGKLNPMAFLEPFDFYTWLLIFFVSIQASAVFIFFFEWLSPQSYDMKRNPPGDHKFSLFRVYWLVWATLFSASVSTDVPRSHTARFMALVWAAFSLMFYAVYTANLAAFMITRTEYHKLKGIDDEHFNRPTNFDPAFKFGTVMSGNTEATIRANYKDMYKYIKGDNDTLWPGWRGGFRSEVQLGVKSVKNGDLDAFIYDAMALEYLAGKDDNCEILTVGEWSGMTGYGFGFPKGSKWLQAVNKKLLEYRERGDLERLENFWFSGACTKNSQDKKTHSVPLGVENFMSAFILLFGGTVVCMALLCVEYIYCNYIRSRLQKIDKHGWCGILSLSMARSLSFREVAEQFSVSIRDERIRRMSSQPQPTDDLQRELRAARQRIKQLEATVEAAGGVSNLGQGNQCNPCTKQLNTVSRQLDNNGTRRRFHDGNYYIPVKGHGGGQDTFF